MKRILRSLLAMVLIQSILCADALAIRPDPPLQSPKVIKISKLVAKLGSGTDALVAVRLNDKSAVKGYVSEVAQDSFLLVDPATGESNRVAYGQINRLQGVNIDTGVQVSHGLGIRSKLLKVLTVLVPGRHVQGNHLFGVSTLLIGIILGIILAIVLAKTL
jgi:hypothetical protein